MTPSMGMAAPKGVQAPAAGLGALAKPAQAPKGKSPENMGQIMALARKMSDMQLADVLSGKSLDVPQYVAMTEAMGRKQLRTAMQGQQAMAQAKQPSIKDKLMADQQAEMMPAVDTMGNVTGYAEGGLTSLPAPNMDSMDMAAGGIVAFADNPDQPVREGMPATDLTEEEKKQLAENPYMQRVQGMRNAANAFLTPRNYDPIAKGSDILSSIQNWGKDTAGANAAWEKASKARSGELKTFTNEQTPKGKLVEAGLVDRNTPIQDVQKVAEAKANRVYPADVEDASIGAGMTALANTKNKQAAAPIINADQRSSDRRAALMGTDTGTGITPEKRDNPFGQLKADLPDYARVKSEGLGEGLMVLSGALLGNPNISMALSQGLPALAKVSGATRKEVSELKKDYNAQQLSLAKANELFESGQEDLALKKLTQSQNHAYHMQSAMASMMQAKKPSGSMDLVNLVMKQNPQMSVLDAIREVSGAKNDPRANQALQASFDKRSAYDKIMDEQKGIKTFDQWVNAYHPSGGATMASNTGGFSAVYGPDNKQIR
jgi:hypothetical protein